MYVSDQSEAKNMIKSWLAIVFVEFYNTKVKQKQTGRVNIIFGW